ncbi:hypothetical protein ACHWQZ_G012197 [Mnemiopsis leidyi]
MATKETYTEAEKFVLVVYLGAVVIPVALIMNFLMILAFVKYRKLRITGMYFILNLAVNNLIATTISAPIIISSILKDERGEGVLENGIACDIRALLDNVLLCASAVTLAVSSVDRCLAVCRPFTYHKIVTTRRAVLMIAGIWIVCTLVCLPPVHMNFIPGYKTWGKLTWSRYTYSCGISLQTTYPLFYFVFTLFIPVLVAIISYSAIFFVAAKSIRMMGKTYKNVEHADFKRRNRTLKSALRTLALVGVFAITFLPILVISCIVWVQAKSNLNPFDPGITATKILVWVVYSGYALNPLVYGLMDRNFRGAYKTFIKCDLYHDEFRKRAQEQLYSDLEDERRRSCRPSIYSASSRSLYPRNSSFTRGNGCNNGYESLDRTQSFLLTEIRSNGGSGTPGSAASYLSPTKLSNDVKENGCSNGGRNSLDSSTKSGVFV